MGTPTLISRERQDHAYDLRLAGYTFQEIADANDPTNPGNKLYASPAAARNGYLASADRHSGGLAPAKLPTAERRALVHDRYDLLVRAWMEKAVAGDELAAGIVARALAAQARLYGLNLRPAFVSPETGGGEDAIDEIARQRAERRNRMRESTAAASPPPG